MVREVKVPLPYDHYCADSGSVDGAGCARRLLLTEMLPTDSCRALAQVRVLSGGEKARLALAKFMLTPGTLLVLDEPTNHLDIPSKEMLEDALTGFDGAVIAVSHDRYFLRRIATRIIAVSPTAFSPLSMKCSDERTS